MVMEYVPGQTLEHVISRDGRLPVIRVLTIAIRLLEALEYAHKRGVIHRDVKSSNIIIALDGGVKVMDFGIARVLGGDRLTRVGLVVGTLSYMSPEQIQGLDVDARSDIYSAGIVLYEMLAGNRPFHADTEWALMQAQISQPPPPFEGGLVGAAAGRSGDVAGAVEGPNGPLSERQRVPRRAGTRAPPAGAERAVPGRRRRRGRCRRRLMRRTAGWLGADGDGDAAMAGHAARSRSHRPRAADAGGTAAAGDAAARPPARTPAAGGPSSASASERTPPMAFPAAQAEPPKASAKARRRQSQRLPPTVVRGCRRWRST